MSDHKNYLLLVLILFLVPSAAVGGLPTENLQPTRGQDAIHGGPANGAAKADRDTFLLMGPTGSGATFIGDFESPYKALDPSGPFAHGWSSIDYTETTESHWQVSDYFAVNGTYSAWCGDLDFPSCDGGISDPDGGYGNVWNDFLEYRGTVDDIGASTSLTITATANIHSEPGYDGTFLRAEKAGVGFVDVNYWDGEQDGLSMNDGVSYLAGEYLGPDGNEIVLVWNFISDGGFSDEDCSYPSSGGIQLDDVNILSSNGGGTGGVVDFEDGTLDPFRSRLSQNVGDFARIRSYLGDIDRCASNASYQVSFIDDGVAVPGTGGSSCQDWCYGPGGYIVTTTGGLAGPESHLQNAVLSPVMPWLDPDHSGGLLTFTVFEHEDLAADSPGIFYNWAVRSTDSTDPADIEDANWKRRTSAYYGGPNYLRRKQVVDDLLVVDPTYVQIRLDCYELGWIWGWFGNNGYPAPYFDNVRFETYPALGPALVTREIDLAQDLFPASGTIDMADPGALSCRFDGAQDISLATHLNPTAADSITFDAVVTRSDAVLEGVPLLAYKVRRNPMFAPYKTSSLPDAGRVPCGIVTNVSGDVLPDRYFGDLDDEGFLFPGDVVHYYLVATDRDTITGTLETSILPADTTGYSDFDDPLGYSPSFTVHCLPTITDPSGTQPPVLFWNDNDNRGGRNNWYTSFANLGLVQGRDYDTYYTNGPSSGVGNGLGGRSTTLQLDDYETLLYTSGNLGVFTISNGDIVRDSGPDVQNLSLWLDSGDRHAFLTGDDLATDLQQSGLDTGYFLNNLMAVQYQEWDVGPLIGGQSSPRVFPTSDNPVFTTVGSWIAYGGCDVINNFDAVSAASIGTRIAIFGDDTGAPGDFPYSACTLAANVGLSGTSEVISMPYDFMYIQTDPNEGAKVDAELAARTRILRDVLARFGIVPNPLDVSDSGVPAARFGANHYPNPFNPLVNISLTIARPGRLTVKVFDVRGRLVRSLFDEQVDGQASLVWNGRDDHGADAASGVYFYEARMHGEARIGKVTLVR